MLWLNGSLQYRLMQIVVFLDSFIFSVCLKNRKGNHIFGCIIPVIQKKAEY